MRAKKVRVLIVDDSRLVRKMVSDILKRDSSIEIIGEAKDGEEAVKLTCELKPDVVLLDIILPKKDGITALKEIMSKCPVPVVLFSSVAKEESLITIEALEEGAVDFILKPGATPVPLSLDDIANELIRKIKIAASVGRTKLTIRRAIKSLVSLKKTTQKTSASIITVIGASTGGPPIISYIMSKLNSNLPTAILIVQHMPPLFTKVFAERLDKISPFKVKEAEDNDIILNGHAYVAPGGKHMVVEPRGNDLVIRIIDGPRVHGVKPAVDVTLKSVAEHAGRRSIAIILTGMGHDGAQGCLLLKKRGGIVVAQDRRTSVVYGMPKAVADIGIADLVLPYYKIPEELERIIQLKLLQERCLR